MARAPQFLARPSPAWLLLATAATAAGAGGSMAGDLRAAGRAVPSGASMLAGPFGAAMGCAKALAVSCEEGPAANPTNASTFAANSAPPSASIGLDRNAPTKGIERSRHGEIGAHTSETMPSAVQAGSRGCVDRPRQPLAHATGIAVLLALNARHERRDTLGEPCSEQGL